MSSLKTPILSILIGEGGSGGALALAVADEVWMMENAVYSILSPEDFQVFFGKTASVQRRLTDSMKLTAADLKKAGIVERVFEEPAHFSKDHMEELNAAVKKAYENLIVIYDAGRESG